MGFLEWIVRLQRLDRRIIFSFMFVAVTVPFYLNWPPVEIEVSREVEDAYQIIDRIPPHGDPLLLSFDYDPAAAAELTPMAEAVLHHCFSKGIRVLVISLQYTGQGAGIASEVVPRIAAQHGRKQDVDWAFLGFQPNALIAMLQMGEDFKRTFPTDYYGTPFDEIPLVESVQNYAQIPAVLTLAATAVGESWAIYPGSRYGLTVIAGVTAVYTADIQPFYQSGQIKGVLGGLKGAAEYEKRVNVLGKGMAGMRSQKTVHYMIILFIALGNIAYWLSRGSAK
ncbi:MAG: hypothetical protein FJY88_06330 [Candidatus Eisenbacteria bacterium]|nr:hypothetical protein [Candidatus Eisenbacteria bacterium]